MTLDEPSARRVVLVQAIETVDTAGSVIVSEERERIDDELHASHSASDARHPEPLAALLVRRAERLLALVQSRHPRIAALQEPAPWSRWLLLGVPVLTLLLGLLTDRIADPHKVDLLSQPLLAIVLWNLVAYLVMLVSAARPRRSEGGLFDDLRRWAAGVRLRELAGGRQEGIALMFLQQWQRVSAALSHWRVARMLHLAAAGWAAGVALSLIARGAVVEYQVGWESTWFDAAQVHAFLQVLLMPAVALLGVAPLSLEEVSQLEMGGNSVAEAGRRWVYLYATLLLAVVIVPRLLLAAFARWRERALARAVPLDLEQPYFEHLAGRLIPTRVRLALRADERGDREALLRVLAPTEGRQPVPAGGAPPILELARAGQGDLLQLVELPAAAPAQLEAPRPSAGGTLGALARRVQARAVAQLPVRPKPADVDLVLQVVSRPVHLQASKALQRELGRPVLLLARPTGSPFEDEALFALCGHAGAGFDWLPFDAFAASWIQEPVLMDAVARHLAPAKRPGFERLRQARERQHRLRLAQAAATIALQLREAACETEEVTGTALSLRDLLPAERRAGEQVRKAAFTRLLERLQRSAEVTLARLLELYGIDPAQARPIELRLEEDFVVQGAVNTPQAGLAGAATGAAMGASVDLMVGGITLGAAAALGALVGGGAATVAAALKNKSTGPVSSSVLLSDAMLLGLTEAALLRYLAVVHFGRFPDARQGAAVEPHWKAEVAAVVQAHREPLQAQWALARAPVGEADRAAPLTALVERMALEVLQRLHPAAPAMGDAPPERARV